MNGAPIEHGQSGRTAKQAFQRAYVRAEQIEVEAWGTFDKPIEEFADTDRLACEAIIDLKVYPGVGILSDQHDPLTGLQQRLPNGSEIFLRVGEHGHAIGALDPPV